ncbi:hypothetical protein L1987_36043 [Smallanthus sonchifolius]|uniref:Uncharacterized protein n=1 Tax=Smallanthus sonchifolius TaxID=185202 RepID=A0ACB9HCC5_9ASTR|nr:hypothetical protein L1987_36043 [Smallanthus sonchifolius]
MSRVYLGPEGNEMRLNWIDPSQGWMPYLAATVDSCAQYGLCGAYGICNINRSPACSCMEGFEPRYPAQWNAGNWSGGCQSEKPLNCGNGESFLKLSGVKLPDTQNSWYILSMNLKECEQACKRNCSCTAYGNLDIRRGGRGCLLCGYISPEYAVHRVFSVKSDVFSFGVLVLEIVSGMKNRKFSSQEHNDNFLDM